VPVLCALSDQVCRLAWRWAPPNGGGLCFSLPVLAHATLVACCGHVDSTRSKWQVASLYPPTFLPRRCFLLFPTDTFCISLFSQGTLIQEACPCQVISTAARPSSASSSSSSSSSQPVCPPPLQPLCEFYKREIRILVKFSYLRICRCLRVLNHLHGVFCRCDDERWRGARRSGGGGDHCWGWRGCYRDGCVLLHHSTLDLQVGTSKIEDAASTDVWPHSTYKKRI
jgi:hypothetical protein